MKVPFFNGKMAEDYRAGRSSVHYPENIMNDGNAKAFYGAVCSGIKIYGRRRKTGDEKWVS